MTHRPELPDLPELPDRGALLAEPDSAVFDRIEHTLFDRIEGSQRARGARHRLVAAASAVVLLGAGGAAWVALATPQLRATSTYCYAAADTSAPFTQVGSPGDSFDDQGNATPVPYPADRFAAALDNCAAVWGVGFFEGSFNGDAADNYSSESYSSESEGQVDDADERSVPNLTVCVRPDQVPAVFPRYAEPATSTGSESSLESDRDFCLDLGLTSPPTE